MTVDLRIEHLAIDAPDGRRPDPIALKQAIERELAALIERDGMHGLASVQTKSLTATRARPAGRPREVTIARDAAARIHEAIKR
jgi:hypothetical protein